MRRRRDGLKPETFPFLAVLLCALGALILLLLIMDRRAKAVARAKAAAAAERALADRARDLGCHGMCVLTDRDNLAAMRTYRAAGATEESDHVMLGWEFGPGR